MSLDKRKKTKFSYDVYKDLIINNGSIGYKKLLNLAMKERINHELESQNNNIFKKYYQKLIWEQFKNTKSILQLLKYVIKGTFKTY